MPIPQVNDRIKEAPAVMLRAVFAGVGQLLLAADKIRARAAETGWRPDRTASQGQTRAQSRWHTLDGTRSDTVPLARERANSHNHSPERPAHSPERPAAPRPGHTPASPASRTTRPASRAAEPSSRAAGTATRATRPAAPAASPPARSAAKPAASAAKPAPAASPPARSAAKPAASAAKPAPSAAKPAASAANPAPATEQQRLFGDTQPLPGYDDLSLPALRGKMRALDAATLRAVLDYEKAHANRADMIAMVERRLTKITSE
jgi:hypothetical protein